MFSCIGGVATLNGEVEKHWRDKGNWRGTLERKGIVICIGG